MSVFLERDHLFLRNPRGGVEDVAAMVKAGFTLILLNIGDHTPSEWDTIRDRCYQQGAIPAPWLRTQRDDEMFSEDKLWELIDCADEWNSPLCVNSESELKGTGGEVTSLIAEAVGERDAAISMECWPFDKVDWFHLAHLPMMPQISHILGPPGTDPEACRQAWIAYGIPCVVNTYGSFQGQAPTLYNRLTPFGVYTADDCGGNYAAWSSQGSHSPCAASPSPPDPPNGGTVPDGPIPTPAPGEKIGTEHGITAYIDWVQSQPGTPKRDAKYNPAKPATWPWPERLERALRILVADHDAE